MMLLTENSQSQPRSEFAHQTNLHNLLSRLENKNLKSPRRRKLGRKLHDIFIFLCFRSSYQRKSATVFNGLVWTWEISPKKERVLLTNFRKLSNPYIQYIHTYIYKNWHTFPTPEILSNLGLRFLAACSVLQGASLSTFIFSMSQEVKKGPSAALNIESSQ